LIFFTPFVKGRKVELLVVLVIWVRQYCMELINNIAKKWHWLIVFAGIGERIREDHELLGYAARRLDLLKHLHVFFWSG